MGFRPYIHILYIKIDIKVIKQFTCMDKQFGSNTSAKEQICNPKPNFQSYNTKKKKQKI